MALEPSQPRRSGRSAHPATAAGAADFEPAFDALVERHYAALCAFALRLLGSPDAAEDAVQDVLCKVWSRQAHEPLREPLPYLYQAVRNQCLMALRRERRWRTTTLDACETTSTVPPADDELRDFQEAIARAIEALPERTRLVFTLHRHQRLTYGEIARTLGLSVKTVETQMTRALKSLRRRLAPFFGAGAVLFATHGPGLLPTPSAPLPLEYSRHW